LNTTEILQILLFCKNNLKKIALQQKPKGLEMSGSPYWKGLELLRRILQ